MAKSQEETKMRTIKLNNKIYIVPAETIIDYLSYRKIVNDNINADDAIHMYVENIKRYYAEKEMAYNNISFDDELMPALEKIALELI